MARMGAMIPVGLLERALANESALAARLNRVFDGHDVLMTPAVAAMAPLIGRLQGRGALWTVNTVAGWVPFNGIWNVTGQPAAAVPAGMTPDGLPRSVQLVGRPADEATLLSLAGQLEAERPWAELHPPQFG
jgi:amidase